MTRRGGQLPWGTRSNNTLYGGGRRSSGSGPLVLGAIVLGVLALLVFLVMRACGGGGCNDAYCASDRDITTPDGYERVTRIYEYNQDQGPAPEDRPLEISLPLATKTDDARNLSFYRYVEETQKWEPLAAAAVDAKGEQALATLPSAPQVVAVLRRLSAAGHVAAYLPKGGTLHPEAAGKITILHTRDYEPASDGTVQGSKSQVALEQGVAWMPSVWADSSKQGMIPIVSTILASPESRTRHVQELARIATEGGFAGIDIAYLDLPATERTNFTLLIAELAGELHKHNKQLSLTLPPPQKTPARIDEGAYDWAQLGKSADILQMAPYRDQGKFRQVMPDVLGYLTGIVEPGKLVLTVSPYATETSAEGIRTMTLAEAMVIATQMAVVVGNENRVETNSNVQIVGVNIDKSENLTGISWSTDAASVFFTYKQGSGRTVYLENFFSLGFKLELIPQFDLGGVAIEDASNNEYLGNIWRALNPFISSGQPLLLQPNQDDLLPQWTVSQGTKEGGNQGSITWATPPEAGTYTVRLTLSDGVALFQNEIQVQVQPKQTASTPAAGG